jgi:hypothetical protein
VKYPFILIIGRLSDEENTLAVYQNTTSEMARKAFHKQLCDIWEDRSAKKDLIIEAIIASNEPPNVLDSDTMVRANL